MRVIGISVRSPKIALLCAGTLVHKLNIEVCGVGLAAGRIQAVEMEAANSEGAPRGSEGGGCEVNDKLKRRKRVPRAPVSYAHGCSCTSTWVHDRLGVMM